MKMNHSWWAGALVGAYLTAASVLPCQAAPVLGNQVQNPCFQCLVPCGSNFVFKPGAGWCGATQTSLLGPQTCGSNATVCPSGPLFTGHTVSSGGAFSSDVANLQAGQCLSLEACQPYLVHFATHSKTLVCATGCGLAAATVNLFFHRCGSATLDQVLVEECSQGLDTSTIANCDPGAGTISCLNGNIDDFSFMFVPTSAFDHLGISLTASANVDTSSTGPGTANVALDPTLSISAVVPEIDPKSAAAPAALLLGVLALSQKPRKR